MVQYLQGFGIRKDKEWAFDDLISLNLIHLSKKLNEVKFATI